MRDVRGRALVVLAVAAVGCAAASATARSAPPASSSGGAAPEPMPPPPVSQSSEPAGAAMPTARAPSAVTAAPAPSMSGSALTTADTTGIARWESQLEQGTRALSSASGDCRDICRASGDICVAANEICGLTGDGAATLPGDPRCGHARAACSNATQQRHGACPVCPDGR